MTYAQALIFLHGGGQGSWVWSGVNDAVRRQDGDDARPILTLDVPGCGTRRAMDAAELDHDRVVAMLADDIRRFAPDGALLVGHSQAGTVLPRLAAAARGSVAALAYIACCAPLPGQTLIDMMGTGPQGANPDCVGWPCDMATAAPGEFFTAAFCNDMTDAQRDALLDALGTDRWPAACAGAANDWGYDAIRDVPAGYVLTMRDAILPVAWQTRSAEQLGAPIVARIDSGHQPMQTRPHALAELLRGWRTLC